MTDNNLKRQHIISVVAIAFSVAACSTTPSTTPKLEFNQMTSKLANLANTQAKAHLQLPPVIKNPIFNVPAKYQSKIVYKVKPSDNKKVIALTIDDGPWQNTTSQILDILKANNVKATFFWVGQALQANPDLAKREVAEGHAIGNHTWHHWYQQMNQATAQYEIEHTADLIYKTTGVKTTLFRPPGGFLNNGLAAYAKSQKETVIMWSLTSADTDPHAKPQAFVNNVLKGAKPGSIVLMHDGGGDRQRTVQALPEIINGLKQQGYRFVTVPELLKMQS